MKLITTANFLHAYSRAEISSSDAIKGIGASGYRELTQLMADLDIPLPRGAKDKAETQREVDDVLPILRERLIEVGEIEP
ncbi:hypothetical protein [Pseudosulfitobacter pseudonitzschiae]|uniref:hypothetical protein n=1 Tax=Pseudosulfitobacter pseudonitzschiae TaxID=1402135 RepID=UPI003B3057DB